MHPQHRLASTQAYNWNSTEFTLPFKVWTCTYRAIFRERYHELKKCFYAACVFGKAFTNTYSFCIGMVDNTTCDNCSREETIAHLLCKCSHFSVPRKELSSALGRVDYRPLSEASILETLGETILSTPGIELIVVLENKWTE